MKFGLTLTSIYESKSPLYPSTHPSLNPKWSLSPCCFKVDPVQSQVNCAISENCMIFVRVVYSTHRHTINRDDYGTRNIRSHFFPIWRLNSLASHFSDNIVQQLDLGLSVPKAL